MEKKEYPKCVGCGYCCLKTMCLIGLLAHGTFEKRCPYLFWQEKQKRYRCSLVPDMTTHGKESLGIGAGCPSSLNDWRKDIKFRG